MEECSAGGIWSVKRKTYKSSSSDYDKMFTLHRDMPLQTVLGLFCIRSKIVKAEWSPSWAASLNQPRGVTQLTNWSSLPQSGRWLKSLMTTCIGRNSRLWQITIPSQMLKQPLNLTRLDRYGMRPVRIISSWWSTLWVASIWRNGKSNIISSSDRCSRKQIILFFNSWAWKTEDCRATTNKFSSSFKVLPLIYRICEKLKATTLWYVPYDSTSQKAQIHQQSKLQATGHCRVQRSTHVTAWWSWSSGQEQDYFFVRIGCFYQR